MKRYTMGFSLLAVCALTVVATAGDEKKAKLAELPLCPITGEPVDFSLSADTDMGPIYACCKRCVGKLQEDPAKFASASAEQRAVLAKMPKVQVTCPISGDPVDGEVFATVNGEKVFTCCGGCAKKLTADPAKYKAKIAASYTYQTRCPVMGGEIDPAVFATVGDEKVYFCCKMCAKPFAEDPAKYGPNLELQGYGKLAGRAARNKG